MKEIKTFNLFRKKKLKLISPQAKKLQFHFTIKMYLLEELLLVGQLTNYCNPRNTAISFL